VKHSNRETFPITLDILRTHFGDSISPDSYSVFAQAGWFIGRTRDHPFLGIIAEPENPILELFHGELQSFGTDHVLRACPKTHDNCMALRLSIPHLRPRPLGLGTAFGFGDRLGLATPGHVRALKAVQGAAVECDISPVFAQQSVRENSRTGRTPQAVLDDASWGQMEGGWYTRVGADADHLKTLGEIDQFAEEGYSLFTFDPEAFVDPAAETAVRSVLTYKLEALPWGVLGTNPEDMLRRYDGLQIDLGHTGLQIEPNALLVAAAKYGRAIAHVVEMFRHLTEKGIEYEVEISIDETDTPTSPLEHFYIASELKRLQVCWVTMTPRYVGRFEKGTEYIGDIDRLEKDLVAHSAIALQLGPYKLGLHSGSDKFSVYPVMYNATRGLVHVKTAGTSYLEALRLVAKFNPDLFKEILVSAVAKYPEERMSYHVSADVAEISGILGKADDTLPDVLNHDSFRQILHVTFGSALEEFGDGIRSTLNARLGVYYDSLSRHFSRHLTPFLGQT
jgi:hypothetical protein